MKFWTEIILIMLLIERFSTTPIEEDIMKESPSSLKDITPKNSHQSKLNKLKELLKVLEITTFLEGDIDPTDKITLTTRIVDHLNGETTYITPTIENIDGEFKYSQTMLQQNGGDKYVLSSKSETNVKGSGNIGLHVQQFDAGSEKQNKQMYKQYSTYLKKYIDYLYKHNLETDSQYLKTLKQNFIYYGSLANGDNPSLESSMQTIKHKKLQSRSQNYKTLAGSQGEQDSTISYGVSNLKGESDTHSFQNMVSTSVGDSPISGLKLKAHTNIESVKGSILGHAITKPSNKVSITTIDSSGSNEVFGFSDNASFSDGNQDGLSTVAEINNLSTSKNAGNQMNIDPEMVPTENDVLQISQSNKKNDSEEDFIFSDKFNIDIFNYIFC